MTTVRPTYRKVSVSMPHCPTCNKRLEGDNSTARPWRCPCGVWRADSEYPWRGEYEIVPDYKLF